MCPRSVSDRGLAAGAAPGGCGQQSESEDDGREMARESGLKCKPWSPPNNVGGRIRMNLSIPVNASQYHDHDIDKSLNSHLRFVENCKGCICPLTIPAGWEQSLAGLWPVATCRSQVCAETQYSLIGATTRVMVPPGLGWSGFKPFCMEANKPTSCPKITSSTGRY